jgi:cytochrome c oxidase subunit IV
MAPYDQPDGAREQIHLPGHTLVPFFTAVGIAIALIGLILSWWFVALGGLIFVLSVVRWIGEVRDDIASLPTERQ